MQGRNIEEEMSRFEAEINAARAQAFIMGTPTVISGPMVTSSAAVISAPPSRSSNVPKESDEDVLATLQKYENQVKEEVTKKAAYSALAKDIASKKAKLMSETAKKVICQRKNVLKR